MMQNKKAQFFMFFLFFVTLGALIVAFIIVAGSIQKFDATIGKDQFKVIETQLQEELFMFSLQKIAEFAAWDAIKEFSEKGGFITKQSDCGLITSSQVWHDGTPCYPDFTKEFSAVFTKKFREHAAKQLALETMDLGEDRELRFNKESVANLEYEIVLQEKEGITRLNGIALNQIKLELHNTNLQDDESKVMDYYFRPSLKVDTDYDFNIFLQTKEAVDAALGRCIAKQEAELDNCINEEFGARNLFATIRIADQEAFVKIDPPLRHKFSKEQMPLFFAVKIPPRIEWKFDTFTLGDHEMSNPNNPGSRAAIKAGQQAFKTEIRVPAITHFVVQLCAKNTCSNIFDKGVAANGFNAVFENDHLIITSNNVLAEGDVFLKAGFEELRQSGVVKAV